MERSEAAIQHAPTGQQGRRIKIVKRLTCPRITTTLDLERCRACRYHESNDGSRVKCGLPYKG